MTACPRCYQSNIVIIDRDMYGWYRKCLVCGWWGDVVKAKYKTKETA